MITLSIIIPVYNVEKYVRRCLLSALENDIPQAALEVIVVNDETPDNSMDIVNEIASQHSNVTVINQKNKGLGGARNTGLKIAKGDYILFLDSDDWYVPDVLKSLVTIASENNLEILEFGAKGVNADDTTAYLFSKSTKGRIFSGIEYYNRVHYMHAAWNKLYNRRFLVENRLMFLERIYIEDFEFNTRAFALARRVMATDIIAIKAFQSPDSITRSANEKKRAKLIGDLIQVLKYTRDAYHQYGSGDKESHRFFKERMAYLNATIFYKLYQNNRSYGEMKSVKRALSAANMLVTDFSIKQPDKNIFRKVILNNFWIFRFTQLLKRLS